MRHPLFGKTSYGDSAVERIFPDGRKLLRWEGLMFDYGKTQWSARIMVIPVEGGESYLEVRLKTSSSKEEREEMTEKLIKATEPREHHGVA